MVSRGVRLETVACEAQKHFWADQVFYDVTMSGDKADDEYRLCNKESLN